MFVLIEFHLLEIHYIHFQDHLQNPHHLLQKNTDIFIIHDGNRDWNIAKLHWPLKPNIETYTEASERFCHSYIWQSLLRLAHTNKPDFSTKKLLRSYPKRQKFLVIFWNNLVPSYMQGVKVIAKCNYDLGAYIHIYSFLHWIQKKKLK